MHMFVAMRLSGHEYAARANMVERYSGCYDVAAKIRSLPLEKEKS